MGLCHRRLSDTEYVDECKHLLSGMNDGPGYKKARQHTSPVAAKTSVHDRMTPGVKFRVAAMV